MNTVIRSTLVVLALAMPALAGVNPPPQGRTVTVSEREFARSEVAPTSELSANSQGTRAGIAQQIVELENALARARGVKVESLSVVGDVDSHPMWP